jgi:hypothetical protein
MVAAAAAMVVVVFLGGNHYLITDSVYIKFVGQNLKFRTIAIFVVVYLQTPFAGIFAIYFRTFHIPTSIGQLVIAVKLKYK